MSNLGIFLVDKGWFLHPAFAREPFTEREAWLWMIARAAKVGGLRVGAVRLSRGQFADSYRYLARRFKWSVGRVQRFLNRLVTECMITIVVQDDTTLITLCNYNKYQVTPAALIVTELVTESATESQVNLPKVAASSGKDNGIRGGPEPPDTPIDTATDTKKETNLSPSESQVGVGGGDARTREPLVSERATELANEVMQTLCIDITFVPPGWCGAPMWFQAGLSSGWRPEVVRVAAARIRARRNYQPPLSYRYLLQPIVREHQLMAEPMLPIPPVIIAKDDLYAAKIPDATNPHTWQASRDRWREAKAELKASVTADEGDEAIDGSVVRFTATAGRDGS